VWETGIVVWMNGLCLGKGMRVFFLRILFLKIFFPRIISPRVSLREREILFRWIPVMICFPLQLVEGIALEKIKRLPAIHRRRVRRQGVIRFWGPRTAELGWGRESVEMGVVHFVCH
jgi:hypothetical protein